MVRRCVFLGGVLMLLGAALSGAATITRMAPMAEQMVDPGGSLSYVVTFKEGARASAIVTGKHKGTAMGLYIYDPHGNCVAWDDTGGGPKSRDDLAAEWYPSATAPYTIEVRNFGRLVNSFKIALR